MFESNERKSFLEGFIRKNSNYYKDKDVKISRHEVIVNPKIERWEYLYRLGKVQNIKIQKKKEQQENIKLQKQIKECTFSPKVYRSKNLSIKSKVIQDAKDNSFVERSWAWKKKKENKLTEQIKTKNENEIRQYSFQPVS